MGRTAARRFELQGVETGSARCRVGESYNGGHVRGDENPQRLYRYRKLWSGLIARHVTREMKLGPPKGNVWRGCGLACNEYANLDWLTPGFPFLGQNQSRLWKSKIYQEVATILLAIRYGFRYTPASLHK